LFIKRSSLVEAIHDSNQGKGGVLTAHGGNAQWILNQWVIKFSSEKPLRGPFMVSKPASKINSRMNFSPEANLKNFCTFLGVKAPRCEVSGINTGQSVVRQWTRFPRMLTSADNSRSSMQRALRSLPENVREYRIAKKIVDGMFLGVPDDMVSNELFHDMIRDLRICLIRTPEQHLAAICADLGISVPQDNRQAEKMAASVLAAFHQPIYAHRIALCRGAMYHSLRALPEGSLEHNVAKVLVTRVTNMRRVPYSIQHNEGYRQVAATLRQGLGLA
jgi:hypothetical protein